MTLTLLQNLGGRPHNDALKKAEQVQHESLRQFQHGLSPLRHVCQASRVAQGMAQGMAQVFPTFFSLLLG